MTERVVGWRRREPPLPVAGVMAEGEAAGVLADRLAIEARHGPIGLRVHVEGQLLVALGEPTELTWAEGVTWLGQDGPILCPTDLEPDLPTDLIARAVRRHAGADGEVVVTPNLALTLGAPTNAPNPEQLTSFAAKIKAEG